MALVQPGRSNMETILKFHNFSKNPDPVFAIEGDAGFDIRISKKTVLRKGDWFKLPTSLTLAELSVDVKKNYPILEIRPRSGNSLKKIDIFPTIYTSDNKGEEIHIIGNYLGEMPLELEKGFRLAQGVVNIVPEINMV